MPYKDAERKRQWEAEHRAQRNAWRRMQRLGTRSGQPSVPKATSNIAAALGSHRKPAPDPASDQKPQGRWKAVLGLAVGIGVVLLAAFAGVSGFNVRHFGTRGSGNLGKNPGR